MLGAGSQKNGTVNYQKVIMGGMIISKDSVGEKRRRLGDLRNEELQKLLQDGD